MIYFVKRKRACVLFCFLIDILFAYLPCSMTCTSKVGGLWFKSLPSHTSDLKRNDGVVATLPDAWSHGFSTWAGWPGGSILYLGRVASLDCTFYISVAARKTAESDQCLTTLAKGRYAKLTNHRAHVSSSPSPRLCLSTAGCSPPSMSSIAFWLLLSYSRWFPPSLLRLGDGK